MSATARDQGPRALDHADQSVVMAALSDFQFAMAQYNGATVGGVLAFATAGACLALQDASGDEAEHWLKIFTNEVQRQISASRKKTAQ